MSILIVNENELFIENEETDFDRGFLAETIYPTIIILSLYFLFIFKWGPAYMKTREPFKLNGVLIVYNLFLVLYNFWIVLMAFSPKIFPQLMNFICGSTSDMHIKKAFYRALYYYYVSKLIELMDTVFFVLRKKHSQISFLHVYHHSSMAFTTFIYLKYMPGQQGTIIGLLNSIVHVIMYTYYFVAALGPEYKKYLWWKKYMTSIQIGQFILMLVLLIGTAVAGCDVPKPITLFLSVNAFFFLYLFSKFYKTSYETKKESTYSENLSHNVKTH